jgi:hypothetical protein
MIEKRRPLKPPINLPQGKMMLSVNWFVKMSQLTQDIVFDVSESNRLLVVSHETDNIKARDLSDPEEKFTLWKWF